jgi:ubiquinone/menaquinone biosynthesis C-methylase UbiE
MTTTHEYALERSQLEYERLALQGEVLKPMTRRLFEEAGIGPGMRVVDLGSGAGDVCLLLAEMVGPSGRVIGLEVDDEANKFAAERARREGFNNIRFLHLDVAHYVAGSPLDAVVGRCILMYQPDPAAALGHLVKYLRKGGTAAFMEPWFLPPGGPDTMMKKAGMIIHDTLQRSGAHTDLGPRLHKVFSNAGLPLPHMRLESVIDSRDDSPLNDYLARTVAHLLPKTLEYGLVEPGEIDPDVLAKGARAEMSAAGYATFGPLLTLAWSSKE